MMPADEDHYGQWPKCGEIDIMEVLGDKLSTTYGTLHFGEPHTQSQGSTICRKMQRISERIFMFLPVDGTLVNFVFMWMTSCFSRQTTGLPQNRGLRRRLIRRPMINRFTSSSIWRLVGAESGIPSTMLSLEKIRSLSLIM